MAVANRTTVTASNNVPYIAIMSSRDDALDGTVPALAMHLAEYRQLKSVTVIDNLQHGASYDHPLVRLSTLYSIYKIVSSFEGGNS